MRLVDEKFASLQMALNKYEHLATAADLQENIIAEATERLSRRNNFIIRNLPETNNADADTQMVKNVLSAIQNTNTPAPVSVTRIGRGSATKPRLVKVRMNDPTHVTVILRNKKKLIANEQYKKIVIFTDQTPQQTKYLENLRTILKQRQEAGENVTIKYKHGVPAIVPVDAVNTTATTPKN